MKINTNIILKIRRKKKKLARLCALSMLACLLAASITGCGSGDRVAGVSESLAEEMNGFAAGGTGADGSMLGGETDYTVAGELITASEMFTERDLSGEYDTSEAEKIVLSDGDVTITKEGVYLLSGVLTDGMIIVDVDKKAKVQLVFDGVEIENEGNAAVYVKQADKVFITLAEGSENSLTSRGYTSVDGNNIDSVIYAKSDLTINGTGSLTVNAVEGHGIVSKDDLKVTGGGITVTAQKQGLSGKDSVRIGGGAVQITSGKDGIHAENDEDTEKGYVYISDGTIQITADGDGISAGSVLQADGGTVSITAGGGSDNRTVAVDDNGDAVSAKGIKAAAELVINQMTLSIDSQDDAIHSNQNVVINSGELSLATGNDGIHADETVAITGGSIHISDSYEGIEGNNVEISGGTVSLYATDDGMNAAGGNDQSGFGGMFGGGERFGNRGNRDPMNGNAGRGNADNGNAGNGNAGTPHIQISGGVIRVHADGDGLDSNGDLLISGGEVYVSGPENGANGALDYDRTGQITGGILVAVGNSAMAMNFGDTSTQGAVLLTTANCQAGTVISLKDSGEKELVTCTSESAFNSVVVSCPELVLGGTYTVTAGQESTEVTLSDSLIYGSGFGMGGFGNGGRMPGREGFQMPGGEMPEMPNGEGFQMPGGEMPEMPNGEGFQAPDGRMPEMPGGERPQVPDKGFGL